MKLERFVGMTSWNLGIGMSCLRPLPLIVLVQVGLARFDKLGATTATHGASKELPGHLGRVRVTQTTPHVLFAMNPWGHTPKDTKPTWIRSDGLWGLDSVWASRIESM